MANYPALYQFGGIVAGVSIVLVAALKWLIGDWYRKSEEIEKWRKKRISSVEKQADEVRTLVRSLERTIIEHTNKMERTDSSIIRLEGKMATTIDRLDGYVANLEAHVKTQVRTEVLELTDQLRAAKKSGH